MPYLPKNSFTYILKSTPTSTKLHLTFRYSKTNAVLIFIFNSAMSAVKPVHFDRVVLILFLNIPERQ